MPVPQVVESLVTPNSRTATTVLTTHESTAVDDTLIIIYGSDYYTLANMPEPTSSAGALISCGSMDVGNNSVHAKVYTVNVETSGSKTVTFPAHIDCDIFGFVLRVPGPLTVDAVLTALTNPLTNTAHVAPSVVTTGPDRLLVCMWITTNTGSVGSTPYTLPGGMTSRGQITASPFSASACATEGIPSEGATGTRTATFADLKISGALSIAFAGPSDTPDPPDPPDSVTALRGPVTLGLDLVWTYGFLSEIDNPNGAPGNALTNVGSSPSQANVNNNFRTITDKINAIIRVLRQAGYLS